MGNLLGGRFTILILMLKGSPSGLRPYMGDAWTYTNTVSELQNPIQAESFSRLCGWSLEGSTTWSLTMLALWPLASRKTCIRDA